MLLAVCLLIVSLSARRAWIEILSYRYFGRVPRSLSARRAWIEMFNSCRAFLLTTVALRKESVDRNVAVGAGIGPFVLSLSARRAWIEITA